MDVSAIALSGLQQAQSQFEQSAAKVASAGATASTGGMPTDTVDLSAEMVAQLSAKNQFSANLSMLKTADQMMKSTIDLLA